jgi:hypothetical protein
MDAREVNRVSLVLLVTGGLLGILELIFAGPIWSCWAWITSGGHSEPIPPDVSDWLYPWSKDPGPAGTLGILLWAFASAAGMVFLLSRRPLQSFLRDPSKSTGWPSIGLFVGLLSGLSAYTLFSFVTILVFAFSTQTLASSVLLIATVIYSGLALYLLGLPIGLIGGIVGSVSELVLRRIYRATNSSATTPDK